MPDVERTRKLQFKEPLLRRMEFRADTLNDEDRTVELSFSSEEPYERWFGIEILDHKSESIRLERIKSAGPLLFNHDRDQHIGRIMDVGIKGGKGVATVKFSKSSIANDKLQDVRDGILREVSVGYRVHAMKLEGEADGKETYRVTDWEPLEVSLVSIPADTTVGVGRDCSGPFTAEVTFLTKGKTMSAETVEKKQPVIDVQEERNQAIKAERQRAGEIRKAIEMSQRRGLKIPNDLTTKADAEGWDGNRVAAYILENQPEESRGADTKILGAMQNETKRTFSLLRMLNSLSNQRGLDGFEGEVCQEMAKTWRASGLEAKGFVVPLAVFRGLQAGDFTSGGATVATEMGGLIEKLDNATLIERIGATSLNGLVGNISLPRQTGGATAYWVPEGGSIAPSNQSFDDVALSPRGLGCNVPYTKQFLAQSSIGAEAFVRNDINDRLNIEIDRTAWMGKGTSGEPKGIFSLASGSGIKTVTFGSAPTWAKVVEFETEMSAANSLRGTPQFVTTPAVSGAWKTKSKDTGSGMFIQSGSEANGYTVNRTNQFASPHANKVIFGQFSDMILARWAGVDLVVDPYTLAHEGKVRIVALTHVDIAYRHPESFVRSTDAGNQ
jgi:HK97 family phage major capsid protein/HK97 family phage prohead protease